MASISSTTNGILLDYAATSHIFSKCHLFSFYQPLTNDKYVIIDRHNCVLVAGIGSVTLNVIFPNDTSKLTLTNTFHIPNLSADLISLGVLHCKDTLIQSWKRGLMISKDGEDLFTAVLERSTGTLYQVQCVDASNGSTFVAEAAPSIRL